MLSMHHCPKYDIDALGKQSRQERFEEVCCSVCRILFCCANDRAKHEEAEHGIEAAEAVRRQKQLLSEKKPLVCSNCCQVFLSGLFVTKTCNNVSALGTANFKATGSTHVLIIIPEWAVEKYLIPHQRKRSWDNANEDCAEVEVMVHSPDEKAIEDCVPPQDLSFTRKTNIQGILSKQRKTDLSLKRARRVTFSPVTAVAFTSRLRTAIVKVESREAGGESPDEKPDSPIIHTPSMTLEPRTSDFLSPMSAVPTLSQQKSDNLPLVLSSLPTKDDNQYCSTTRSPAVANSGDSSANAANGDCVFSPPLPEGGANGVMMTPQMSSTPVNETSERRTAASTPDCQTDQENSQTTTPGESIFSSLANVICCAFQALPFVVTQFFSSNKQNERRIHSGKDTNTSRRYHRQQRRRSSTFTPYTHLSAKNRRLDRCRMRGQPLSPLPIVKFLSSSPPHSPT